MKIKTYHPTNDRLMSEYAAVCNLFHQALLSHRNWGHLKLALQYPHKHHKAEDNNKIKQGKITFSNLDLKLTGKIKITKINPYML